MTTEFSNMLCLDELSSIPYQLAASTQLPRDLFLLLLTEDKRFRWDLGQWKTEPGPQHSSCSVSVPILHTPSLSAATSGSQGWKHFVKLLQWKEVFVHGFPSYCLLCHKQPPEPAWTKLILPDILSLPISLLSGADTDRLHTQPCYPIPVQA